MEKTLKIGLPKGDAIGKSQSVISAYLGWEVNEGTLHYFNERTRVHFYLLKPRDIPKLVYDGALDAGVTLMEWVIEKGYPLHTHTELDWCDTRVSLLTPRGQKVLGTKQPVTCVTEFPNIAEQFFQEHGENYTIEHVSGSCEGMVPSIYNCAVDCVETGASARRHNLKEEAVVVRSRAVLVTKTSDISMQLKQVVKDLAV